MGFSRTLGGLGWSLVPRRGAVPLVFAASPCSEVMEVQRWAGCSDGETLGPSEPFPQGILRLGAGRDPTKWEILEAGRSART